MRYRMLKSRRQFLQNVVFGGAAFALSSTLRTSQAAEDSTAPLVASPMPQPDATIIWSVAFSSPSQRMAVSAGSDEDLTSLYVNSPVAPENFQVYWSPDTEVHGVTSLAWSHNEEALAFIGMSGSRTTKTAEVWLYVLDVASGEIRKVLKIGEADHGEERRLVNVDEDRAVLAWFGNNKVCMPTRDQSIIAVDCNDGHIETLVPAQDCKIEGPVSVSPNILRFLKWRPSGQGWELEVCEFDGSKIISYGVIPITADKISAHSRLSADGAYIFICVKEESTSFLDKIIILDVSQMASVKEIPLTAKSGSESYIYFPVTVLEGEQLVLFEAKMEMDKHPPKIRRRLCTVKL
jgi:hypothetical protein